MERLFNYVVTEILTKIHQNFIISRIEELKQSKEALKTIRHFVNKQSLYIFSLNKDDNIQLLFIDDEGLVHIQQLSSNLGK